MKHPSPDRHAESAHHAIDTDVPVSVDGATNQLTRAIAILERAEVFVSSLEHSKSKQTDEASRWDAIIRRARAVVERAAHLVQDLGGMVAAATHAWEQAIQLAASHKNRLLALQREEAHAASQCAGWGDLTARLKKLLSTLRAPSRVAAAESSYCAAVESGLHANNDLQSALKTEQGAREQHRSASRYGRLVASIAEGIQSSGFSKYLSRATNEEMNVLKHVAAEAHREGCTRAGRKASAHSSDRASKKRAKHAAAASTAPNSMPDGDAGKVTSSGGEMPFTPHQSFHARRKKRMSKSQQAAYQARVDISRERGRTAILSELKNYKKIPFTTTYQMEHPVIPLNHESAFLVAVRGDSDHSVRESLALGTLTLETWLGEPAIKRNTKRKRARLQYGAGHLLVALPVEYRQAIITGTMDVALGHVVDSIIARLDLEGHRVAGILHLDSKSGHPNLHIVFAQVRKSDSSLWDLDGRSRTPALWIHGRAQTAKVYGVEATDQDIDALGGSGDAAIDGEVMMEHDDLVATRSLPSGKVEPIALQGPSAVRRLANVGECAQALPGGMWKFGLGPDPEKEKTWAQKLTKAKASNDHGAVRKLMRDKPKNRGWWLDFSSSSKNGKNSNWEFTRYLFRG